jgi:GTPase SAR1 family protein
MTNKKYKLIIVGHSNVGKTSIIKRYFQEVHQYPKPTIGTSITYEIEKLYNNI